MDYLLTHFEQFFSLENPWVFLGIFGVTILADIGIPVPFVLDTLLVFSVFKSGPFTLPVLLMVASLLSGRYVGSSVLYVLSDRYTDAVLDWLRRRLPRVYHGLDTVRTRVKRNETLAVVSGRLTPGLLQITSVASGVFHLKYRHFCLGIAIASFIYDGVLILIGYTISRLPNSIPADYKAWMVLAMVLIIAILWPLFYYATRKQRD